MSTRSDVASVSNSPEGFGLRMSSSYVGAEAKVSRDSFFSEPVWNMSSLVTSPGLGSYPRKWSFVEIPGYPSGYALSIAEYAYARLYDPRDSENIGCDWVTVQAELLILSELARYCAEFGLSNFSEVTQEVFLQYLRRLQFGEEGLHKKSRERIYTIFRCIYRFWSYSAVLTRPFSGVPLGKGLRKVFKSMASRESVENRTPIIPEPIYSCLMRHALDYVETHSQLILPVWREVRNVWREELGGGSMANGVSHKRFKASVSSLLAGAPAIWLCKPWSNVQDVYKELHQLRVACILVLLAYSGIRPSELLSVEAGCCVSDIGADGRPVYYLNTKVRKHRGLGGADTWVVIEEVVRAVAILEELTKTQREAAECNLLLLSDGKNNFFSLRKDFSLFCPSELTYGAVICQIQSFVKSCNTRLVGDRIPQWADKGGVPRDWRFNARQFRRTLARYIARQPFGVIAGMLQYKHVEVAIFQGYAGSEPEWNKLLDEERILASIDLLEEVAIDLSNGDLGGDVGELLKSRFLAEFRGRAEDFPPSQIAKWLANSSKSFHVGKFNFCFFEPSKARCTGGVGDAPVLNYCQPDKCENACIGKRHIPIWRSQLMQAEEIVMHSKSSIFQIEIAKSEALKLRAIVDGFERKL